MFLPGAVITASVLGILNSFSFSPLFLPFLLLNFAPSGAGPWRLQSRPAAAFPQSTDTCFFVFSTLLRTSGVLGRNPSGDKCNPKSSQKKLSEVPVGHYVDCV